MALKQNTWAAHPLLVSGLPPQPHAMLNYCHDPNFLPITVAVFSSPVPIIKFYTATLNPAAEYMSCDTSMLQSPPKQCSCPVMMKSNPPLPPAV